MAESPEDQLMSIPSQVRRSLLLLIVLLCASASTALSSCSATKPQSTSAAPVAVPVLQFGVVADPEAKEGTTEYKGKEGTMRLRDVRSFDIKEASASTDGLGRPAVQFEIADGQKEEFRRWTGSIVEHQLAIIIDGVVVTTPRVMSALPGKGILEGGAQEWSEQDVKILADRIRSRGSSPTK
jgi:preprotein translocase subunit SecD